MNAELFNRVALTPPNPGAWADPANAAAWQTLRARYLTSSDMDALVGGQRYCTRKKLFKLKLEGLTKEIPDNERLRFGREQEAGIAIEIGRTHGLRVEPMLEFITLDHPDLPEIGLASTFDWCALGRFGSTPYGKVPLEIKTANPHAFIHAWRAEGNQCTFAGRYVEWQVQAQMLVGGFPYMHLGVGIGTPATGIRRHLYGYRKANALHHDTIWQAAVRFNKELAAERKKRARRMVFQAA